MAITFYFRGDQVATSSAIDDDGNGNTSITIGETPFLSTDIVAITFQDSAFDPVTGEFVTDSDIVYESVQVTRDGVTYDLTVDEGSKVKESGGGSNKEQGDSFFQTNDSIGPAASGPFSNIPEDQYVFSTTTTFTAGEETTVSRVTTTDFNDDGDTTDAGEAGNSNFNQYYAENNPFICFTRGTLILTTEGYIPVQELKVGDLVETLDNGPMPIAWIGSRRLHHPQEHLAPVTILENSFGNGVPFADLAVSPQHRLLLGSPYCELLFGSNEVLSAAKFLCNGETISKPSVRCKDVEYFHLLFSSHQVIWANGVLAESLFLGDVAKGAIGPKETAEVLELFPELNARFAHKMTETARMTLKRHEAALLVSYDPPANLFSRQSTEIDHVAAAA